MQGSLDKNIFVNNAQFIFSRCESLSNYQSARYYEGRRDKIVCSRKHSPIVLILTLSRREMEFGRKGADLDSVIKWFNLKGYQNIRKVCY